MGRTPVKPHKFLSLGMGQEVLFSKSPYILQFKITTKHAFNTMQTYYTGKKYFI